MKITVKLFATLREGREKILDLQVAEGTIVQDVLDKVEIEKDDIAILLINGRDGLVDQKLKEGDVLSLFPPVGGG